MAKATDRSRGREGDTGTVCESRSVHLLEYEAQVCRGCLINMVIPVLSIILNCKTRNLRTSTPPLAKSYGSLCCESADVA